MKAKMHVALAQIAVEPVPGPVPDALGDPAGQRPTRKDQGNRQHRPRRAR